MNRPEEILHRAAVDLLMGPLDRRTGERLRSAGLLPAPWFCFHVPNGGGRTKAEAGILKAMGTLAGMPDLFVLGPLPKGAVNFWSEAVAASALIAIELKAPPKRLKGGGLSKAKPTLNPHQRARQADLGACGVPYLVIDDLAELQRALAALGVPLKGQVRA